MDFGIADPTVRVRLLNILGANRGHLRDQLAHAKARGDTARTVVFFLASHDARFRPPGTPPTPRGRVHVLASVRQSLEESLLDAGQVVAAAVLTDHAHACATHWRAVVAVGELIAVVCLGCELKLADGRAP